jgi:hypothetical protein
MASWNSETHSLGLLLARKNHGQTKVKDLSEGDMSSKLFHAVANGRKAKNSSC